MFKNYLKTALNNLRHKKIYALINISGLAVGMAASILILLFVQDELSFDQYHEKKERIHRVISEWKNETGFRGGVISSYILGRTLKEVHSNELEDVVRVSYSSSFMFEYGDKKFTEEAISLADPGLFNMFSYKLLEGNPETALVEPFTMVLTQTLAQKYFGDENPVGKTIMIEQMPVKITGVMEDIPTNSHAHYNAFVSMKTGDTILSERVRTQWGEGSQVIYLLLKEGIEAAHFQSLMPTFISNHAFGGSDGENDPNDFFRLTLQPLTDIHLKSNYSHELEANGNITYVYIFLAVAFIIILIASINYMNLATARSAERSKEVGMRKVVGAHRSQIIAQFMGESILTTFLGLSLAILIAELFLPTFNEMAGKELSLSLLENPTLLIGAISLAFLVGVISGSYPALFLSSFKPSSVLKGSKGSSKGGSVVLRKALVVIQFSVSIILIIGTLVVNNQLHFLRNKDLGINTDYMLNLAFTDSSVVRQYESLKTELLANSNVKSVTATNKRMTGRLSSNLGYTIEGAQPNPNGQENYSITTVTSDYDFFKTYEAEIVMGRDFSREYPSDLREGFIINESAMKLLGLEDPIGKSVKGQTFDYSIMDFAPKEGQIVGVVKDFNYESLYSEIRPVMFQLSNDWLNWVSIKISTENMPETIAEIERTYKLFDEEHPVEISFLDDRINELYMAEERFLGIFTTFAILAILIATLGIFGLASFTAEKRRKEIGIRKVLGSSVSQVTMLITKDFIVLILIASAIGLPSAYFITATWLEDFTYKISLSVWVFLGSVCFTLFVALLTVSTQAIRAGKLDPAKVLRQE